MKQRANSLKSIMFLLILTSPSIFACENLPERKVFRRIMNQSSNPVRLIFFSSWCSSCIPHLEEKIDGALYIGAFDSADRINEIDRHYGLRKQCFFDRGRIATELGVVSLPAEVLVTKKRVKQLTGIKY